MHIVRMFMSEHNDIPPVPKLRTKISKEIEALTSSTDNEVLAAATKDDTQVVFFMPRGTEVLLHLAYLIENLA
jgi:hypothetical protein